MIKILFVLILLLFSGTAHASSPGDVVINEVAWMGTTNSANDEWMELYNNTQNAIDLEGWILKSIATDGIPTINLQGSIVPFGFFLLERTDNNSVPSQKADQIYTGALKNDEEREHLQLVDTAGNIIDGISAFGGWPAGYNPDKQTMERKDPKLSGEATNWGTSVNPGGTPRAQNSVYQPTGPAEPAPNPQPNPNPQPEADPPLPPAPADDPTPAPEPVMQTSTSTQATPTSTVSYPDSIFINELMPFPRGPDELEEWVEITNESDLDADISFWAIKDSGGVTNSYIFPNGSTLSARGFLVLSRPTSKITLNNDADGLGLIRPDGKVAQVLYYNNAPKGSSYARAQDGWQWSNVPTPGSANILPAAPVLPTDEQAPAVPAKSADLKPKPDPKPTEPTIDDLKEVVQKYKEIKEGEDGKLVLAQESEDDERAKQLASILDTAPGNKNTLVIFGAIFLALFSGVFIFLLRKRTRGGLNEP